MLERVEMETPLSHPLRSNPGMGLPLLLPPSSCSCAAAGHSITSPGLQQEKLFRSLGVRRCSVASSSPAVVFPQIPVEGPAPEGRHSHSACSWKGGVLVAGGLGAAEQPLGSLCFLEQLEGGFRWQALETRPPLVPR